MEGKENGTGTAEVFEKLLESFEKYRELENKAVKKIKEQLAEKGIEIPEEQIRGMDKESIRQRLFETRERRLREEQAEEKSEQENKKEQGGRIR